MVEYCGEKMASFRQSRESPFGKWRREPMLTARSGGSFSLSAEFWPREGEVFPSAYFLSSACEWEDSKLCHICCKAEQRDILNRWSLVTPGEKGNVLLGAHRCFFSCVPELTMAVWRLEWEPVINLLSHFCDRSNSTKDVVDIACYLKLV